jgi:hypothetical protein
MLKKFMLGIAVVALTAFAGTVPGAKTHFKITLVEPSVLHGTQLKTGDVKLTLGDSKITVVQGKESVEAPAKFEEAAQKFNNTSIRYITKGDQQVISEIRIGGTTTKIVVAE